MNYFSIKELESFSGIKAHTIRTWEQRFSFLQPSRSTKLRRTYSIEELKLLLDIALLNRNGYKVSHIARMDKFDIGFTLTSLSSTHHKRDRAINELITCMAVMDTEGFEMVLQSCMLSWGINDTINHVLIPFTHKAGLLQKQSEKFYKPNLILIEQSIKQKIMVGIDKADGVKNGRSALLFAAKRSCELELLYLHYTLKTNGFATIFISNFSTLSHLQTLCALKKPQLILSAVDDKRQPIDGPAFIKFVNKNLPQTLFYNLGYAKNLEAAGRPDKVFQFENVDAMIAVILEKTGAEASSTTSR